MLASILVMVPPLLPLTMVKELYSSAGAGQESEIYAFASDVDADQRMEIDRMRGMLMTSKELAK